MITAAAEIAIGNGIAIAGLLICFGCLGAGLLFAHTVHAIGVLLIDVLLKKK